MTVKQLTEKALHTPLSDPEVDELIRWAGGSTQIKSRPEGLARRLVLAGREQGASSLPEGLLTARLDEVQRSRRRMARSLPRALRERVAR